jgi:hypothetical protein
LPNSTYGLDVLAHIAYQHNEKNQQFREIWQELGTEYKLEISEREVGLLYRRIQALLMGNQVQVRRELKATAEQYGQLMMAVDALQPDGSGPKLYILHELLSETLISAAMLDQATEDNLVEWLSPYREWRWVVKGTLSDNEKALVTALKVTFSEAVHQLCQMHFVKDLSDPVHEADRELQKAIRDAMGQLPPVEVPEQKQPEQKKEGDTQSGDEGEESGSNEKNPQVSLALMQAMDIISGVEINTLDLLLPEEWEGLLAEGAGETSPEETAYLHAEETRAWISTTLLSQVPLSVRPLIENTPSEELVTYWDIGKRSKTRGIWVVGNRFCVGDCVVMSNLRRLVNT